MRRQQNHNKEIFQEGAFALCFKSKYFPGECVATRRGSPLLVGIKTKTRLATDHVPILYGKGKFEHCKSIRFSPPPRYVNTDSHKCQKRSRSYF
jgi:glucosamine--fructose-6-phosphate aminotransferase (isomerizing)